jgi:hypothetical protein
MPNPIKYSTGSETLALKKGNMYIGTGDVGKGPSDVTGYYQGVDVPSGGYVIYMNKEGAPGGLSYHSAANDSELIAFTNNLAGQSYTTVNECLVYFAGQSDKVVLNRDYEGIITDGLVLNLDAGFTASYPRSGTTWTDLSLSLSGNNGTLTNGPTFNSANGGNIVFDGTNDYVDCSPYSYNNQNEHSVCVWFSPSNIFNRYGEILQKGNRNDFAVRFADSTGKLEMFYEVSGSTVLKEYWIQTNNILTNNIWYHASMTFSNIKNEVIYYLNSEVIGSYFIPSDKVLNNSTTELRLGNISQGGGIELYNGKTSIAMMYNRALSATEVLQNYNAQKGRFGL